MKIAIYIDADNSSFKICNNLMYHCYKYGDVYLKKIYADWTKGESNNWKSKVLDYGLEAIQVFRMNRKQSTDIHLITDMIKDISNLNFIDIVVLVSSDSDFSHLCHVVNSYNKKIIIVGEEGSVLRNYCNEFWPTNNFIENEKLFIDDENIDDLSDKKIRKILKTPFKKEYIMLISEYKKKIKELLPKNHNLKLRKIENEIIKYLPNITIIYYNNRIYLAKIGFLKKFNKTEYNLNKGQLKNNYPILFEKISEKKILSLLPN